MDKLAIIRGIKSNDLGDHTPTTSSPVPPTGENIRLRLRRQLLAAAAGGWPAPYVSLMYKAPGRSRPALHQPRQPTVRPRAEGLDNLSLARGIKANRLDNRHGCSSNSIRSAAT
jgi:hypothetical protein